MRRSIGVAVALLASGLGFAPPFGVGVHNENGASQVPQMHQDTAAAAPRTLEEALYSLSPAEIGSLLDDAINGRVRVRLSAVETLTLLVKEFDPFVPGERKIVALDAQGNVAREAPLLARFFKGFLEDHRNHPAYLTIAPEGVYGVLIVGTKEYSLQPRSTLDGQPMGCWGFAPPKYQPEPGKILQSVVSSTPSFLAVQDDAASKEDVDTPSTDAINYHYYIKPYVEQSYVNCAADWYNRVANAYGYAGNMWANELSTEVKIWSVVNTQSDFASTDACGGFDTGLTEFRQYWVADHLGNYKNSYGLLHAYDAQESIAGCGYTDCVLGYGCLNYYDTPGPYNPYASHVVQGFDCCWFDSYDPNDVNHLAKAAHHEITHNAGEPGHPNDSTWPCDYNIMVNGINFNCVNFWRTAGTIDKVKTYGWPRFRNV